MGKRKSKEDLLIDAVESGSVKEVQQLLGGRVNLSNALWIAAARGKSKIVGLLLDSGADPKKPVSLEYGIEKLSGVIKRPAILKKLLAAGADPNELSESGMTPLMAAAWEGRLAAVDALLEAGADPDLQWIYDGCGETAYWLALKQGHSKVADCLRDVTSPNLVAEADKANSSPSDDELAEHELLKAVEQNDVDTAQQLLKANVDPNSRTDSDVPVFHYAVRAGKTMTRLFLESGVDVNVNMRERYIDETSADPGKPKIIEIAGANALHFSMHGADDDTVRLLIDSGIDVNAANGLDQITPLMEAVQDSRPEMIRLLIEHGADPKATSRQEKTAVEYRNDRSGNREERDSVLRELGLLGGGEDDFLNGRIADVDSLRDAIADGLDVNAKDDRNRSCLYLAIVRGQNEFVPLLLDAGADVSWTVWHDADFDSTWAGVRRRCPNCDHDYVATTDQAACPVCGKKTKLSKLAKGNPSLERFTTENVNTCFNNLEMTPLLAASRLGQADVVRLLREHGAAVKSSGQKKCLMTAIWFDHRETAKTLLDSGVDTDFDHFSTKETAMSLAVIRGDLTMTRELQLKGAKCRFRGSTIDKVLLVGAAETGNIKTLRTLLGEGINPNVISTYNGQTALCAAAIHGQEKAVVLLLEHSAKPDKPNQNKETPLALAKRYKQSAIVGLLGD